MLLKILLYHPFHPVTVCTENKGVDLSSVRKWAVMESVYSGDQWGMLALCCKFGIPVARLQHQSALLIWFTYCLLLFLSLPIQTSPPPPFYTVLYLWLGGLFPPQVGYKTEHLHHTGHHTLSLYQVGEENCVPKISSCAFVEFKGRKHVYKRKQRIAFPLLDLRLGNLMWSLSILNAVINIFRECYIQLVLCFNMWKCIKNSCFVSYIHFCGVMQWSFLYPYNLG